MAFPIEFPEQNFVWKAPPGGDTEDLPAWFDRAQENISCWRLNQDELAEIQRTGMVWLRVWCYPHPPVYVEGTHPFEPAEASSEKSE